MAVQGRDSTVQQYRFVPGMEHVMKIANVGAFLLSLGATIASAADIPDQGRKGAWAWEQNVASTDLGAGVKLLIVFSEEENCDKAILMVGGNTNITELALTVDGESFGNAEMTHVPGTVITAVYLGSTILRAIKHGHSARVTTNVGSAPLLLSGSAMAINSAYGNCQERSRPLTAETPISQPRSGTTDRQFAASKVRSDGKELLAVHNVVFVFGDIQSGDDILLRELVSEMEDAGIPLKSVIFMQNGGGALGEAMRMGAFIRSKQANTAIGGHSMADGGFAYCASACVFAFAGGVQRTIYLPSKIGMHQPRPMDGSAGSMEDGQKIVAATYEYLSRMGVDPAVVIEGSKRSPGEMWWLSGYEAKGYGLATQVTKPHELRPLPKLLD